MIECPIAGRCPKPRPNPAPFAHFSALLPEREIDLLRDLFARGSIARYTEDDCGHEAVAGGNECLKRADVIGGDACPHAFQINLFEGLWHLQSPLVSGDAARKRRRVVRSGEE